MGSYEDQDNWEIEEQGISEEDAYGEDSWSEDCSNTDYEEDPIEGDLEPEPPDYDQNNMSDGSWSSEENYIEDEEEETNHSWEEEDHEGGSWCDEADSQFSQEGGDHEIEAEHEQLCHEDKFVEPYYEDKQWCEENEYQICLGETESFEAEPWNNEAEPEDSFGDKSEFEEEEPEASYGDEQEHEEGEPEHINTNNQAESWDQYTDEEEDYEPQYITYSGYSQHTEAYLKWEEFMEASFKFNQVPLE